MLPSGFGLHSVSPIAHLAVEEAVGSRNRPVVARVGLGDPEQSQILQDQRQTAVVFSSTNKVKIRWNLAASRRYLIR